MVRILSYEGLTSSTNVVCHPEQSEGSRQKIPRFTQNDRAGHHIKKAKKVFISLLFRHCGIYR